MILSDFDYNLPDELIARYPNVQRSASRLLCLDGSTGVLAHRQFNDIIDLINPGDLLILNNTRVIPARLFGHKASGGKVEILVERILDQQRVLAHVRASKALKNFPIPLSLWERVPKAGEGRGEIFVKVLSRQNDLYEIEFPADKTVLDVLNTFGHMPLPPYLDRPDENIDQERYQTVYAKHLGAVAAPTAGLHFDENLLQQLRDKGVAIDFVTLHVGAGTFQPVRVQNIAEHVMHAEYAEISAEVCEKVRNAKANNKRVIAVGTTSVRCLETAARSGSIQPFMGDTKIFIYPGFKFHCVDAIITNFHLPQSTLLMLVCAFAGYENVMHAYQTAIAEKYRFYSYGDAMWLNNSPL